MAPVLLITRPEPEATTLAAALSAAHPDLRVIATPLQRIGFRDFDPPEGAEPVFTSRNGVRAFRRAGGRAGRAWCVGRGTAAEAEAAGMTAISADGDAEALLALLLRNRPAGPLLHVRGAQHRGALARRLRAAGLTAGAVESYAQEDMAPVPEARAAMAGRAPVIVPLYSPRAAARLVAEWRGAAPLLAGAISPATARVLRDGLGGGCKQLDVAARPDGDSMLKVISGLIAASHQLEAERGDD